MPRDSGGVLRPLGLPLLPTPMDSDAHRGRSLGWLGAVSSLEHHGQVSVALCAGPLGQGCGCGQLLVPCEFSTGRAFMWVPAGLLGPAPALAGGLFYEKVQLHLQSVGLGYGNTQFRSFPSKPYFASISHIFFFFFFTF